MSDVGACTRQLSSERYWQKFEDIKPVLSPCQAHIEASRCLYCDAAPCVSACPAGINIPSFINRIPLPLRGLDLPV